MPSWDCVSKNFLLRCQRETAMLHGLLTLGHFFLYFQKSPQDSAENRNGFNKRLLLGRELASMRHQKLCCKGDNWPFVESQDAGDCVQQSLYGRDNPGQDACPNTETNKTNTHAGTIPIKITCVFLVCERIPEYPTYAWMERIWNWIQKSPRLSFDQATFTLRSNSFINCTIYWKCSIITISAPH